MRWGPLIIIVGIAATVLGGCTSVADDIRHKCAGAASPGECEKAEYSRMRADDSANLNVTKGSGGGY
jgi:hypothetical protein